MNQNASNVKGAPAVAVQRVVRPRTITLSENVRQESPVGFMVFAYKSVDFDYVTFDTEHDALDYAMEQEEKANASENSWPIYALWASEWPNEKLTHSREKPI